MCLYTRQDIIIYRGLSHKNNKMTGNLVPSRVFYTIISYYLH